MLCGMGNFKLRISVLLNEMKEINSFLWIVFKNLILLSKMQVSEIETKYS